MAVGKSFFEGVIVLIFILAVFAASAFAASMTLYDPIDSTTTIASAGGTVSGDISFVQSISGNAAVLSGGYITYPYSGKINPSEGTVQFLAYLSGGGGMFESGRLGYANSIGVVRINYAGRLVTMAEVRKSNGSYLQAWHDTGDIRLENDGWYLVSAIWKCNSDANDFFQIFINGVPGTRQSGGSICTTMGDPSSARLLLGYTTWYGASPGKYDELKIFDYAKTAAQISADSAAYFNGSSACYRKSDCGPNGYVGGGICQNGNIYQEFQTKECINAGTPSAYCGGSTELLQVQACADGCSTDTNLCNVFTKPTSTGSVKVIGRDLFVNGSEYTIKSLGYGPTPIGNTPDLGYDVSLYPLLRARDFPLIRAMGANTIRTWGKVASTAFLTDAWNDNNKPIRVLMGYWMGPEKNYQDAGVRATILADFENYVTAYKDYNAVLAWMIGNEENYFYGGSDSAKHAAYFSLVNEMAKRAYEIEGATYHPVVAVSLEMPFSLNTVGNYFGGSDDASINYVDIWGLNNYPGNTYGNWFSNYAFKTSKPLLITEYGIDALNNNTKTENQTAQAEWDFNLWKEITFAPVSIGSSLMEYSDEWWKDSVGNVSTHDYGGYATSSQPDLFSNEEWWGIVRVTDNGSNPDTVTPRAAYTKLKEAFSTCGVPTTSITYEKWQNNRFTTSELANASISGVNGNIAGDGISNLAKYALCLNPRSNAVSGLPKGSIENGYLTMTYDRVKNTTDLNFVVEVSHNLFTWNSGSQYTVPVSITNLGDVERVKVRDINKSSSYPMGFLRLKITKTTGGGAGTAARMSAMTLQCTLNSDCGNTMFGEWSKATCDANRVVQSRTIMTPTCEANICGTSDTIENKVVEECQYGCLSGACLTKKKPHKIKNNTNNSIR